MEKSNVHMQWFVNALKAACLNKQPVPLRGSIFLASQSATGQGDRGQQSIVFEGPTIKKCSKIICSNNKTNLKVRGANHFRKRLNTVKLK